MWEFAKNINKSRTLIVIIFFVMICLIAWGLYLRYAKGYIWADWTGFGDYIGSITKDQRGKTLWDWLELLIIPIILGGGAIWFNSQEKRREIDIAEDRQRENILRDYFDKMSDLLLKEHLIEKKNIDKIIVDVAQVKTVTALRGLDKNRKIQLIQFLQDANLIDFILKGAPLSNINLNGANLKGINLEGANLVQGHLRESNLEGANLQGANLQSIIIEKTSLIMANMEGVDLSGSSINFCDFSEVNLKESNLEKAHLENTILNWANMENTNLAFAHIKKTDFVVAHLEYAGLEEVHLEKSHFEGAYLNWAFLENAYLKEVSFDGTHLEGVNLNNAIFKNVNLKDASIDVSQLSRLKFSQNTIMPDGSKYDGRFDNTNSKYQEISETSNDK